MQRIMTDIGIKQMYISSISYLEILSGASENAKIDVKKFLQPLRQYDFDNKALQTAKKLAMRYRVGAKQSKDFLIASIAVANKIPLLTENDKDYLYQELDLITYRINQ